MQIDIAKLPTPTRLAVLLALAGLNQAQLAERLGVGKQSVNGWLRGAHEPTARSYKMIRDALATDLEGLTLIDVMGGEA